jgi:hypothetical protein
MIKKMHANFGGTQIYDPVKNALQSTVLQAG